MDNRRLKSVVCIGAAIVDLNFRCKGDPILHTSNPATLKRSAGGVVRNIAHHLALLNIPVELVTIIGNDPDGDWLLSICKNANIRLDHTLRSDFTTGTFVAITSPSGEFEIGAIATQVEQLLTIDFIEEKKDLIISASLVIADCNLSVEALKYIIEVCNEFKVPLIIETVSVAKSHKLKQALPGNLLMVKPNLEEFNMLTDSADSHQNGITFLHDQGIEHVWLSLGSKGSVFSDGQQLINADPVKVAVSDVSGAGDAAIAGWVYAWLKGEDMAACVKHGHALAACLLEVTGAVRNDLTPELLNKYL